MMTSSNSRQQLRQTIRQRRRQQPLVEQQLASQHLIQRIAKQPWFHQAKHIALYFPHHGEIDPTPLCHLAEQRHQHCYFPRVVDRPQKLLYFLPHRLGQSVHYNRFGIMEPKGTTAQAIPLTQLDIIFTPLAAFDQHCHRLGLGGGYYDRTFAQLTAPHHPPPLRIGLAYEWQKIPVLDHAVWDVPLHGVMTNQHFYT
nr:5-formyltetrahydrofolate cyclo-ligase [Legionellales bacterium]